MATHSPHSPNLSSCHRCEQSKHCHGPGPCPCKADPDGRDIVRLAESGACPLGKFGGVELTIQSTADQIEQAMLRGGAVRVDPEWCYWPTAREAFRRLMRRAAEAPPEYPELAGSGVVLVGGGRYFAAAYVTIRMLRHVGYAGPIQLWFSGDAELPGWQREALAPWHVEPIDARRAAPDTQTPRPHYELKTLAVLRSPFERVLYLDADSYPTRNPEFLFDSDALRERGAIFWPDQPQFELPNDTFAALGVAKMGRPLETGQFVVDQSRCWRELNLAHWMDRHSRFYYGLMNGDTGTLRFGWSYFDTPIATPPNAYVVEQPAMLQHDFTGEVLFVHRSESKFTLSASAATGTGRFAIKWRTPPLRNDRLPLESEAWKFFEELRGLYEKSLCEPPIGPQEPQPVQPATPARFDIPLAGDVVEKLAHAVGAHKVAAAWEKLTGHPCGCQDRKAWLNEKSRELLSMFGF